MKNTLFKKKYLQQACKTILSICVVSDKIDEEQADRLIQGTEMLVGTFCHGRADIGLRLTYSLV